MVRISVFKGPKKLYGRIFFSTSDAAAYVYGALDIIGEIEEVHEAKPYPIEDIRMAISSMIYNGTEFVRFKNADDSCFQIVVYPTDTVFEDPAL